MVRVFCIAGMAVAISAAASAAPDFPRGAEARERLLLTQADPATQSWIKDEARKAASAGLISVDHARALADRAYANSGLDVDTLSFLIVMQIARDANADLQAVMDRSQRAWDDQDERSSIANNKPLAPSGLAPGTQTVLSMKAKTVPIMSTTATLPSSLSAPEADTDVSVHVDLQTAMDRETEAEQAVAASIRQLPPPTSAPVAGAPTAPH